MKPRSHDTYLPLQSLLQHGCQALRRVGRGGNRDSVKYRCLGLCSRTATVTHAREVGMLGTVLSVVPGSVAGTLVLVCLSSTRSCTVDKLTDVVRVCARSALRPDTQMGKEKCNLCSREWIQNVNITVPVTSS